MQPVRLYVKGTVFGYKRYVTLASYRQGVKSVLISSIFAILNRRGFTNTYHHTALLSLDGVNDKDGSKFYLGKKVAYIYKAQKAVAGSKFRVVWGKVMRPHGTNGVVRAKFTTNLPVSYYVLIFGISSGYPDHFSSFLCFPSQSTSIGSSVRVMLYPSNV